MKTKWMIAALAAIGALVCSCENEKDINVYDPESKELSLVLEGVATRAEYTAPVAQFSYDRGRDEDGNVFSLEETVVEMGDLYASAPETRGTPAYTENVVSLFGNQFNGVIYDSSGQVVADGAFEVMDASATKPVWRRQIGYDPWERNNDKVTFFLHMPSTLPGVSNLAYNYSSESLAFDFETPATAAEQTDILFASRKLDKATYLSEYKNQGGASVLFRHALTGVKFAIGNNDSKNGIRTFITKVEITGLLDKGHAVYQPAGTETTEDDKTEYTSKLSFTWTNGSTSPSTSTKYTQTFDKADVLTFKEGDALGAPNTFYGSGQKSNLNKQDASLTFWFRPQEITSALKVTVTFFLQKDGTDGEDRVLTLNLGSEILKQTTDINKEWKAGQLRTFTLQPNAVDVEIKDKVTEFEKTDVKITNTGNVDAYIRAYIVANWYGTGDNGEDGVAAGYTSEAHTAFVPAWQRTSLTADNYGGVFEGLPGNGWVLKSDGFFYYTVKVPPGKTIDPTLFTKYSLNLTEHPVPHIWYISSQSGYKEFSNVRLVMEIPVQAVEAKDYTWQEAWEAAGVTF